MSHEGKMTGRERLYSIIFKNDTKHGKRFDIILLWLILSSVLMAILDSVPALHLSFGSELYVIEWIFTVLFTAEYLLRIYANKKSFQYVLSFWGVIDLLAILPTYISLCASGYQYLLVIRVLRMLRVFRVLKLVRFNKEAAMLMGAMKASSYKMGFFLSVVVALVILLGTVIYVVEGGQKGFSSIPQGIYWAVNTVTTVGYGDVVPQTTLGKIIATLVMLIGFAIIAVPTGIVTFEMSKSVKAKLICPDCKHPNSEEAKFCNQCKAKLVPEL